MAEQSMAETTEQSPTYLEDLERRWELERQRRLDGQRRLADELRAVLRVVVEREHQWELAGDPAKIRELDAVAIRLIWAEQQIWRKCREKLVDELARLARDVATAAAHGPQGAA
jgi:hypothetical protein